MHELADLFKALSDETRLKIFALLLLHGELCVCDVEGTLGITQSKASRHLRTLLNARLVKKRREGTWMHYRPEEKPDPSAKIVMETVRRLISDEQAAALKSRLEEWFKEKAGEVPKCSAC